MLEVLGKGAFSEVKKVLHKLTGDIRAMKIMLKKDMNDHQLTLLDNEIKIMK